jgi:FMN phosphatase YigB (HAD superfamily)
MRVVMLDFDGVINFNPEMFGDYYKKKYGYEEEINTFFATDFKPCMIGKADLKQVLAPHLPKWGWNKSVEEFLDYWFSFELNLDNRMVDYIKNNLNIHFYLATNQEKYRTEHITKKLEGLFKGVFSSAYFGCKKQDPEFFRKVLVKLREKYPDLSPSDVIFWDDRQGNVDSARQTFKNSFLYTDFESFVKRSSH